MATDAQITANRNNAQASTGPTSPQGRSKVSRNAVSSGLCSSGDFVRPGEEDLYAEFCAGFQADLAPEGAIECTLSAEIVHAAWRLRRCSVIEAGMLPTGEAALDPLLDEMQQSVDRARAQAHRIFHRATAELRRFQTERRLRAEPLPKDCAAAIPNPAKPAFAKQSQSSAPPTAPMGRNSPCGCGSGIKFKRCCGPGAPAVLNRAA